MTTIKRFTPDYKMHAVRFEAFAREAEHGEYVRFDAHQQEVSTLKAERDAQQKRADALAVENAALKDAITTHSQSTHFCELCGKDDPCSTDDVCYALNETPATDAALAALQAQGVEKFADDLHKTAMAMCSVKPDNTAPGAYAGLARSFAKKLREAK
ncbi:hypothetical protein ACJ8LB_23770 [Serratia sp. CY58181]|uniref:hypothetical protein n=1 Tax=Serratia sp. CY58181 TaxID=3383644 RepID=UPI003F9FEE3C